MELAERADALPTGPGVYLFKNAAGRVLYVGKAQNLRGARALLPRRRRRPPAHPAAGRAQPTTSTWS